MATTNTTVVKLSEFPPTLPNIPPNYPLRPVPGKLELLLNANTDYLYTKFSPYTNYQASNVFGGVLSDKQPFVVTSIQTGQANVSGDQTVGAELLNVANINTDTMDDILRVSRFLISSWGVSFLSTQLALQRTAPFDETRIYNPLSPLLATMSPLTLGIGEAPLRHIEPIGSGLLGTALGALNSIISTVGINLRNGYSKPSSTAGGDSALPSTQTGIVGSQGKGMIRGSDAQNAAKKLQDKWITSTNQGGLGFGSLLSSAVNNFASSIAGSFMSFFGGAPKAKGIFRTDEETYKLMADYFGKQGASTTKPSIVQPWYASPTNQVDQLNDIGIPILAPNKSTFGIVVSTIATPSNFVKNKLLSTPDSWEVVDTSQGLSGFSVSNKPTNVPVGDKYGDVVGRVGGDDLTNSEMLVQYSRYVQIDNNYASKIVGPSSDTVKAIQAGLEAVVANIGKSGVYDATGALQSYLLSDGNPSTIGYDNLYNTTPTSKPTTVPSTNYGAAGEYAGLNSDYIPSSVPSIDAGVKSGQVGDNLRMATTFKSDGLNTLGVLAGNRSISSTNSQITKDYTGWIQWRPYYDDLIAFFFYDVVNDKYIPFRATVKAISEGNTAFWDELRFIGRADQLYSYNGFSRTLSFTFNVVISSVMELMPTWKKINYIASAVKPSNYTTGQSVNQKFNRFIVPPMFMITIGDLYKFQPMVITSINVNIPDDAAWETLNQDNSDNWNYLNGLITSPSVGKNYGQLPREAEIAITCNLLEKERAIVGGSHFGHQPRVDDWENLSLDDRFVVGNTAFLPTPTTLHKDFVEWNDPGKSLTPAPATSTVTSPSTPAPAPAAPTTFQKINRGGQTFSGTPGVG